MSATQLQKNLKTENLKIMKTSKNSTAEETLIAAVLDYAGSGVWQITDGRELVFTVVGSDIGLTCSDVCDCVEDAISNKPEVTTQLIDTLEECAG